MAAAESLLVDVGPEGLKLTEVARRAGITHPNVLYHFGSAGELQAQLAQRIAVRLADDVARVLETDRESGASVASAVAAVFRVFDERGYARLLAWLALSQNEPTFEALGSKLEHLRSILASSPALRGPVNAERRRLIVPAIELVVVAAIGYGLAGRILDGLFPRSERRPSIIDFTSALMANALGREVP